MSDKRLRALVFSALMAALCCAATMVVQFPSPTQGYVNLGDCFVLLSGWLLGPWYGAAAGGLGSMLADLSLGYAAYAPGTLAVKGLAAFTAAALLRCMGGGKAARLVSGAAGELVMVAGYFGYSSLLLGKGLAAAASIPGNLVQGGVVRHAVDVGTRRHGVLHAKIIETQYAKKHGTFLSFHLSVCAGIQNGFFQAFVGIMIEELSKPAPYAGRMV